MNKAQYQDYLGSAEWDALRRRALAWAENRCQLCNAEERLEVHHRTYERLGHEIVTDLIVLCASCHETFHGRLGLYGMRPVWMNAHDTIAHSFRRVSEILPPGAPESGPQ